MEKNDKAYWEQQYYTSLNENERPPKGSEDERIHKEEWISGMMGEGRTIVLDTPEQIKAYRLLTLRGALKLEIAGLKHSRFSAYAIIKKEFGLKGNKQSILFQFEDRLRSIGVLR